MVYHCFGFEACLISLLLGAIFSNRRPQPCAACVWRVAQPPGCHICFCQCAIAACLRRKAVYTPWNHWHNTDTLHVLFLQLLQYMISKDSRCWFSLVGYFAQQWHFKQLVGQCRRVLPVSGPQNKMFKCKCAIKLELSLRKMSQSLAWIWSEFGTWCLPDQHMMLHILCEHICKRSESASSYLFINDSFSMLLLKFVFRSMSTLFPLIDGMLTTMEWRQVMIFLNWSPGLQLWHYSLNFQL